MNRRRLLQLLLATPAAAILAEEEPVRIGITPVFLSDLTSLLRAWQGYLEWRIERPVRFVQRDGYREIIDNLLAGRLEFAWVCGYPYVVHQDRLKLVAVPVYQGAPLYRSYLIVPVSDTRTRTLADLKGRLFAYADPDSNSGYLVPRYELQGQGLDPARFFLKTFFTSGHRNAIEAVSVGLADGAQVDGYVWDTLDRSSPEVTRRTRVVSRSRPFAFPPIVAGPAAGSPLRARMTEVLTRMAEDAAAGEVLGRLNLDGFVAGLPADYDEIARMALAARGVTGAP